MSPSDIAANRAALEAAYRAALAATTDDNSAFKAAHKALMDFNEQYPKGAPAGPRFAPEMYGVDADYSHNVRDNAEGETE